MIQQPEKLNGLLIEDLLPTDVVKQGLVDLSISQLYRATEHGRFYCTKPRGKKNGRLYPAWQFVGSVPECYLMFWTY